MKLDELISLEPDKKVAMESTMHMTHTGTRVYSASEACQRYLQLKRRDKNTKIANRFVNDLVEYEN